MDENGVKESFAMRNYIVCIMQKNIVRMIKSRKLRWARHLGRMECFQTLKDKTTYKMPLGRPWHRWKDNIRIYLKVIVVSTRNWIDLTQDRDYSKALVKCTIKSLSPISLGVN